MTLRSEEIAAHVARIAGDLRVVDVADVREGTRGVSARLSLAMPEGSLVRAFLKMNRDDPDCFRREAEAGRLLSAMPSLDAIGTKLLLVDEASRLLVWEELPGVRPIEDVLMGTATDEAMTALSALVDSLAVLHLGTTNLRLAQESALGQRTHQEAEALRDGASRIVALFTRLGARIPDEFDALIEMVARAHVEPGPLVALTHGDQAPTNVLYGGGRARLIDFEFAAVRPMLYDLATWATLCPLDERVVAEMLARYRALATREIPAAGTAEFEGNWGLTCAFRALSMATWSGPELVDANAPWGRGWSARSALAIALGRAATATSGSDLVELRRLLTTLERSAHENWNVEPLVWSALEASPKALGKRDRERSSAIGGHRPPH